MSRQVNRQASRRPDFQKKTEQLFKATADGKNSRKGHLARAMITDRANDSSLEAGKHFITVSEPDWKQKCEHFANKVFEIGGVQRADEILFVADFAARHDLSLVWRRGVFALKPKR